MAGGGSLSPELRPSTAPTALRRLRSTPDGRKLDHGSAACGEYRVKRSDQAQGFVALPKRWIVERTFAWLGRCRRLAKDVETLTRTALAFLRLAIIRLMLRRIARASAKP